jgi:hypothetical protein
MRSPFARAGVIFAAAAALAACGGSDDGVTDPPADESYRVTAFTENSSCGGGTCSSDIRGTARDANGNFVAGATVFTYYTTSLNPAQQQGPTATTNGSGGYVMRFNFPVVSRIDYNIRVCAGTTIRQPDARCAQILTGFQ